MKFALLRPKLAEFTKQLAEALDISELGSSKLISAVLLFTCLFVNIYARLFPAYFPQFRKEATFTAVNKISQEEYQKYGEDNETAVEQATQAIDKRIFEDKTGFSKQVDAEYEKLKDPYQDPSGLTYLMEYDPFTWARWTENTVRNGHPGDIRKNGESFDSFMVAPYGFQVPPHKLLFYLSAFLYKGITLLYSISLSQFLFFAPVFYAAFFLFLFYFFVRRWFSSITAFIAVTFTGLTDIVLRRTSAGWYDFDALSLIMALLVAWSLLEALAHKTKILKLILFSLAAAFFQGLFAMAWTGWWFILVVSCGCLSLSMMADFFRGGAVCDNFRKKILLTIFVQVLYFFGSDFFIRRFTGLDLTEQISLFSNWLHLGTPVSVVDQDVWPNAFYTISELVEVKFQDMAGFFYGKVIFSLSLVGVFASLIKEWKGERRDPILMMLCWGLFAFAASLKGIRFIFYLAPPVFIFLGIFCGDLLPQAISKIKRVSGRAIGATIFFVCFGFLLYKGFTIGFAKAEEIFPFLNDNWYKALKEVDKKTPQEAILNSWWDNGSWYRYFGKRRVIFDGQTQNGQLCYWMAKVLTGKDEDKAVRILRMLNNNSGNTYYELLPYFRDPFLCERVLEDLLGGDREKGARILQEHHVPQGLAGKVLHHLYDAPPPAYFIVERSLLQKISNISFLGNWDFKKLYAQRNRHKGQEAFLAGLKTAFEMTPDEAEQFYKQSSFLSKDDGNTRESLSQRYDFYARPIPGRGKSQLRFFDNGVVYNPGSKEVLFYSDSEKKFYEPKKVLIYENGKGREVLNDQGDYEPTVVLVDTKGEYQSFIVTPELAESLLVKMYFLKGHGLKHFKPFYADEEKKIYIYEIVW